jgi:hypothetical protein
LKPDVLVVNEFLLKKRSKTRCLLIVIRKI